MEKTEVSMVSIKEEGENVKMEKSKYTIDDLFRSLELKEFDTVVFAPREEEVTANGKKQRVTVGTKLKEKVRAALPTTEPNFVKGLIEEAATKYQTFSHRSEHGYEKRVVVGYLTSIGAEELAKTTQDAYFEVPSGLDMVGIAAEGMPNEKATLTARERLARLGREDKEFTLYRPVRIKSDKFGALCGSGSSHLLLEGEEAGYGALEYSLDGTGWLGNVGEYAGKGSTEAHIQVAGDAGSGFMADSKKGHGSVDGNIKGSSAGAGSERLWLYVNGNGGDLLLADSKSPIAYVGGAGSYAGYKAQKPLLIVGGKPGKLLGEGMTEGNVFVKEIDAYAEPGKLLGYSGTGKVTVSNQKYADILLKENKPGYSIGVDGRAFLSDDGNIVGKSCSCSKAACAKE